MELPTIKGFLETSFVDWPGQVAAVVFLPRCNFRCPYCHNHGLILNPESYQTWSLEGVLDHLDGYRNWVDGVCVSGGEPTLHEGLPEFLGRFRTAGWAVKLDTNGSRPLVLAALLSDGLVDSVAIDLKAPLEGIPYRRTSGWCGDPEQVGQSLDVLLATEIPLQVRTTVHPALLSRVEIERLAVDLGQRVARLRPEGAPEVRFDLQRCRTEEVLDREIAFGSGLGLEEFARWQDSARDAYRRGAASVRGAAAS